MPEINHLARDYHRNECIVKRSSFLKITKKTYVAQGMREMPPVKVY